jgi:hypothetical protein
VLPRSFNSAVWKAGGAKIADDVPAVIRKELDDDSERDTLVRMRYLARKKRMLHPGITDDEMADYLALAESFENFQRWIAARRSTSQTSVRPINGFLAATALIVGRLTALWRA